MSMLTLINIIIALAVLSVVVTLIWGVLTMARGGASAKARSNKIMRWRVGLQAVAVAALLVGFFIKAKLRGG